MKILSAYLRLILEAVGAMTVDIMAVFRKALSRQKEIVAEGTVLIWLTKGLHKGGRICRHVV